MAGKSAIGGVRNDETGWTFKGKMDPDIGYVMEDVRHDAHLFAREMFVALVMVAPFGKKPIEQFLLVPGRAFISQAPELIELPRGARAPLGFYRPRFKVSTTWTVANLFGEAFQSLMIEQSTLFTPYNKDPSHEPAGLVKAARVYPLIKFSSPAIDKTQPLVDPENRIAAIRVIYLLGLELGGSTSKNQAGMWKDRELLAAKKGPEIVYAAAEKPLLLEAVGRGLKADPNVTLGITDADWDNTHQWNGEFTSEDDLKNAFKHGGQMPPSPGMPYAAHQHWRWGAMFFFETPRLNRITRLPLINRLLPGLQGGKRFGGVGGAGGPMVDPTIPNQSLSFAVTTAANGAALFYAYVASGQMAFDDPLERFFDHSGDPLQIWQGEDELNTWVDVLARSNHADSPYPHKAAQESAFEGTLFAHGIFFAHNDESVMPFIGLPGAYKPQFIPKPPAKQWRRP